MSTSTKGTPLMRFAAAVADFGNPFYAEERQRDVWNEASAFGFQLLIWGNLVVAAGLLWAQGAQAMTAAQAMVVIAGLGSALTIGYARRLGVLLDCADRTKSRGRLLALVVLVLALIGGFWHAGGQDGRDGWPFVAGTLAGIAAAVGAARWAGRRARRSEPEA